MTNNDYEERKQAEETKRLLEEARLKLQTQRSLI